MTLHGGSLKGLKAIWRVLISNRNTQKLISTICQNNQDSVDLRAGDDKFFALLATDHGKGPGRMLSTYPDIFGRRLISWVRVFPKTRRNEMPSLCWFLDEVPRLEVHVAPLVP
jgi:hypothetical protein